MMHMTAIAIITACFAVSFCCVVAAVYLLKRL